MFDFDEKQVLARGGRPADARAVEGHDGHRRRRSGRPTAEKQAIAESDRIIKGRDGAASRVPRGRTRASTPRATTGRMRDNRSRAASSSARCRRGHDDEARTKGRAYLYFWPGGLTERASIVLRKGDSHRRHRRDDARRRAAHRAACTSRPATSRCPSSTDEKDLSEREDQGTLLMRQRGFSLLEVMVALAIFGLMISGILSAQAGLAASNKKAANMGQAIDARSLQDDGARGEAPQARLPGDRRPSTTASPAAKARTRRASPATTKVEKVIMPDPPSSSMDGDGGASPGLERLGRRRRIDGLARLQRRRPQTSMRQHARPRAQAGGGGAAGLARHGHGHRLPDR